MLESHGYLSTNRSERDLPRAPGSAVTAMPRKMSRRATELRRCNMPTVPTGLTQTVRNGGRFIALGGGQRSPYPEATSPAASRVMRGNRSRDTGPEHALRSLLFRQGLRYRIHLPIDTELRRVRPDVVFPRQRIAVFVDGCFWHGCPDHGTTPRANGSYWHAKLARNRDRDAMTTAALRRAGWTVVRVWEHDVERGATEVMRAVRKS